MKERPILFSGPMVRALLYGSKTQTRRVAGGVCIKQPGVLIGLTGPDTAQVEFDADSGEWVCNGGYWHKRCPYGQIGDRLWVRESFSGPHHREHMPPRDWHSLDEIHYWADGNPDEGDWTKPRPGMFMPRWASRTTLEVTGVRVERLQDISEADARAEGAPPSHPSIDRISREFGYADFPRSWYGQLWDQINGEGAWAANPWVWVVEFRRLP